MKPTIEQIAQSIDGVDLIEYTNRISGDIQDYTYEDEEHFRDMLSGLHDPWAETNNQEQEPWVSQDVRLVNVIAKITKQNHFVVQFEFDGPTVASFIAFISEQTEGFIQQVKDAKLAFNAKFQADEENYTITFTVIPDPYHGAYKAVTSMGLVNLVFPDNWEQRSECLTQDETINYFKSWVDVLLNDFTGSQEPPEAIG